MKGLEGMFEGWAIDEDNGVIYDDGRNVYTIEDIRSLFYQRQLHNTLIGSQYNVQSLKQGLQKKIAATPCPAVTIDWGDGTKQKIKHSKFG